MKGLGHKKHRQWLGRERQLISKGNVRATLYGRGTLQRVVLIREAALAQLR